MSAEPYNSRTAEVFSISYLGETLTDLQKYHAKGGLGMKGFAPRQPKNGETLFGKTLFS